MALDYPIDRSRLNRIGNRQFRRFLKRHMKRGLSPSFLCRGPDKFTQLIEEKLILVLKAAWELKNRNGFFILILLLTGQPRDYVAWMRWGDIDLENRIWTVPEESNGSGKSYLVHLSPQAITLLQQIPHRPSDIYVFRPKYKDVPMTGHSSAKVEIDQRSGVTEWELGDLGRAAVRIMLQLGVDPEVVDLIIHRKGPKGRPGLLVRDGLYRFDEQRDALDALGAYVEGLMLKPGLLQNLKRLIRA